MRRIGQPDIRRAAPSRVFARQIRRQQHPRARVPRSQHRAGEQRGIFKPQGGASDVLCLQAAGNTEDGAVEIGARPIRMGGDQVCLRKIGRENVGETHGLNFLSAG